MRKTGTTLLMVMAAAVALIALAGSDKIKCTPTQPEEPVCVVPEDCDGLPHVECEGAWNCAKGACTWHCGPACDPSLPEVCGNGTDDDCDGQVDEGCCQADSQCAPGEYCLLGPCPMCECPPGTACPECECWGTCVPYEPPPAGCYDDADCLPGQWCEITDGCCPPEGCLPGMACPAVCVPCGECVGPVEPGCCASDWECGAGQQCVDGVCEAAAKYPLCWSDADCGPAEACEGAITCPCGAWCFAASQPGKCVPTANAACYGDDDCAAGQICSITNDCCAPEGCLPGMDCPAVCVPCGVCVDSGESECSTDKDCPPGFVCEQETWCPCPPDTEPACGAPCQLIGKCVQAGGACYGDEDCLPGEVCVIDNDCCPPKGCKPGDICPAVCVACGACQAAPQPVECKKLNPAGYGMCAMVLGVGWDGTKCVTISGCSCGSDCAFFFKTLSDCQAACGPWIL